MKPRSKPSDPNRLTVPEATYRSGKKPIPILKKTPHDFASTGSRITTDTIPSPTTVSSPASEDIKFDINIRLLEAAKKGNLAELKQILEDPHWESASEGEDYLSESSSEYPPLDDVNIDVQDVKGLTPLMRAIINKNYDCAVYLYQQNADVNRLKSKQGYTALGYAERYMPEFLNLIRKKICIDETKRSIRIVETIAELLVKELEDKHFEKIYEVLRLGAAKHSNSLRLNGIVNETGMTAFMYALSNKDVPQEIISLMANDPELDLAAVDSEGKTSLHWACLTNNLEAVKGLIDLPCQEVNQRDHQGRTPLMLAAQYGSPEIMSALLSVGADPKLTDLSGKDTEAYIGNATIEETKDMKREIVQSYAAAAPRPK